MLSPSEDNNTPAAAGAAPNNNNHSSPHGSNSLCEGSAAASPSSIHSHSQPSTRELNNSSQHSLRNETSSDDPTDFSNLHLPANIEMHPQNESLSSSSHQQYIKRPLNAYMIWTRQERKKILSKDPKLKMNEVSKAMGERWKGMSDKEKKPYFEMARKFALEHKQALQDHPELTYAPSKKKGPKGGANHQPEQKGTPGGGGGGKNAGNDQSGNSAHYTPDPSPRSTTPRQIIAAPGLQQNMFVPFQTPLSSGTMQIAQVLGVRPPGLIQGNPYGVQMTTPPSTPVSGHSLLVQQSQQQPTAFAQPQLQPHQRIATGQVLNAAAGTRSTPGQMLDLYYTSLCQPAFPTITESPVNTLFAGGSYPPQYFLEQYNQFNQQQQQQQQQGGGGSGNNAGGAPPHSSF